MNYLGYVIAVFLLVWALGNIFDDGIDTSDDSVKDKIEIIEKSKNTTDPLIKEQGVIASAELKEIQNKKELRAEAKREEAAKAEAKEPFLNNPLNAIILAFGIFGIVFIAMKVFFIRR